MQEPRLFRLAPEAMHLQATFVAGQGWHLSIAMRRGDESWTDAYKATYSHLSTPELADTICSEVEHQLDVG